MPRNGRLGLQAYARILAEITTASDPDRQGAPGEADCMSSNAELTGAPR